MLDLLRPVADSSSGMDAASKPLDQNRERAFLMTAVLSKASVLAITYLSTFGNDHYSIY